MDPSLKLCRVYDSFSQPREQAPPVETLYFSLPNQEVLQDIVPSSTPNLEPTMVDQQLYQQLNQIKEQYKHPNFNQARLAANPFERIGNSIFMDRAAVKLANIDAVFNLTNHFGGYLAMTDGGDFTFADIAGAPGGWTEYVLWRKPNSKGYGMSLRDAIEWNQDRLDMERFSITYGNDNTGDLYTNADWFSNYLKSATGNGVDLAMADGGFNVDNQEDRQEYLTARLILAESFVGMTATKPGGSFVVKVYDTVTPISADIIYLLALAFENIALFKPISSRPANSERYIVCRNRRSDITQPSRIAMNALRAYQDLDTNTFTGLETLVRDHDPSFDQWLTMMNNFHAENQIEAGMRILDQLDNRSRTNRLEFDPYRALAIWKLPDNPVTTNNPKQQKQQQRGSQGGRSSNRSLVGNTSRGNERSRGSRGSRGSRRGTR